MRRSSKTRRDTRRGEEERDMARGWRWTGTSAGLALLLAPVVAAAQERPYEWGWGMHPMWGVWGAWGIGMMLMMLVFWGVVIVGIVLAIRWFVGQSKETRPADTALDILRQRYARGDISKEEFEAKRRDLT
jgi:putative membrane protein